MKNVTPAWEQTHRDNLTRKGSIRFLFQFPGEMFSFVDDSKLISFNLNMSGDILSGFITQDIITLTFDNTDGQFSYNPENDNYTGTLIIPTFRFMKEDNTDYDYVLGGTYFVTDVDVQNNTITFTAKSILSFMRTKVGDLSGTCSEVAVAITNAANLDDSVPYDSISIMIDSSLNNKTVEVRESDGYSQAEVLQLIANAAGCALFVNNKGYGTIKIQKIGNATENYVLSERISFEFPKPKVLEKIGKIEVYYDHGSGKGSTSGPGRQSGGTQTITNPIIDDDFDAMEMIHDAYEIQQGTRQRITGNFRADPRIELFDVVAIPYQDKVAACCLTKLDFTFNGGWRGTYEAVQVPNASFELRICDLEMLKIKQLESLRIEQLAPNTISDDLGNYIATINDELAYWKEDEPDNA